MPLELSFCAIHTIITAMPHLHGLIFDLGITLSAAAIASLVFKKIGQPVVLGYLLAGVLVGPSISFLPTVHETKAIQIWADIGVIFLLFGLGLEFSFRKLADVGRGALVTTLVEVTAMLGLGFLVGRLFGWSTMDSLYLGGILSISSTTIIIRAFDELGLRERRFTYLVFGVLIVEDLVAVLLLVLLSTIAVSRSFEGMQLAESALQLIFFLTIWFVGGIFMIPTLLRRIRSLLNDETSLIVALGLCLSMVVLAVRSGFSPALGAFTMGSILAETPDSENIGRVLKPVKDLFAAVFFISVGMLLDVRALNGHWTEVFIVTLVTVLGKVTSSIVGAVLSGQSLRHSVQAGMSLGQIGEFSFIIATLGLSLKVISPVLYPLAVSVSVITTFITPYLIRSSNPTLKWLETHLPQSLISAINRYSQSQRGRTDQLTSPVLRSALRLLFNSAVVIAVGLAAKTWFKPFLIDEGISLSWANATSLVVAILLSLPSLWAITSYRVFFGKNKVEKSFPQTSPKLTFVLVLFNLVIAIALVGLVTTYFFDAWLSFLIILSVIGLAGVLAFSNLAKFYHAMEERFVAHLSEKQHTNHEQPQLAPWDAHLAELVVHPNSEAVGQTLLHLALREHFGVIVALIQRGNAQIVAPTRDDMIMAHDRLFVIGNDDQLTHVSPLFKTSTIKFNANEPRTYGLMSFVLPEHHELIGQTIRKSRLREVAQCLVVGIERHGQRLLNPSSTEVFQPFDHVWVVGDRRQIQELDLSSHQI